MPDREKVIKGLEIQLDNFQKYADATELLTLTQEHAKEILALLKEQETANLYKCQNCGTWVSAENVVRCKDCKHWYFADNRIPSEQENVCGRNGIVVAPDWYCADGERQEGR